jgi:CheY-like chemotaxis protein
MNPHDEPGSQRIMPSGAMPRTFGSSSKAVLSDINMPGMDGLQLLAEIKERFPDLPVMMVTAYGDDERRRRAAEFGAAEFISKPIDFDQLKAQLRQLPA